MGSAYCLFVGGYGFSLGRHFWIAGHEGAELLAEARYRHGADIEAAISALADVGRSSPLVAQALQRAERE